MIVIADASPLIFLAKVRRLGIVFRLLGRDDSRQFDRNAAGRGNRLRAEGADQLQKIGDLAPELAPEESPGNAG